MTILQILTIIIMICGYGIAFAMIIRIFMVAVTLWTDVPFVPSDTASLKVALEALDLKKGDEVVDLGSGDGKFILYAAKRYRDVNFTGLELNKGLVLYSKINAKLMRLKNVSFIQGDIFQFDISKFTKVYLYLTSTFVSKLMPKFREELPSGARIVSVHFGFGEKNDSDPSITHVSVDKILGIDRVSIWNK